MAAACASRASCYDQVAQSSCALTWESLGERAVKNIVASRPRLPCAASPARHASRPRAGHSGRPHRPSIAVLPFRELDVAEGQPLLRRRHRRKTSSVALASLPDLFVDLAQLDVQLSRGPGRRRVRGTRAIGVRYVLSGSVRRAGERIRITAELADTETQNSLVDGQDRRVSRRPLRAPGPARPRRPSPPSRRTSSEAEIRRAFSRSGRRTWTRTTSCSAGSICCTVCGATSSTDAREMFDEIDRPRPSLRNSRTR